MLENKNFQFHISSFSTLVCIANQGENIVLAATDIILTYSDSKIPEPPLIYQNRKMFSLLHWQKVSMYSTFMYTSMPW